jgi:hypothetical protein
MVVKEDVTTAINNYNETLTKFKNAKLNYENVINEKKTLNQNLNKSKTQTNTNYRKTYYEQEAIMDLTKYYYGYLLFYLLVGVIYLYFLNQKENVSNSYFYFIGTIVFLFPFFATKIIGSIYKLFNTAASLLPDNVFKTL